MSAGPNSAINPEAELPSPLLVKPVGPNRSVTGFALFALALSVVFWRPLIDLARYAFGSDLYSHILLIPWVSLYLAALKRRTLPPVRAGNMMAAWIPGLTGALVLAVYGVLRFQGFRPAMDDYLSMMIFSWYCFLAAGFLAFLGFRVMRSLAFPVGFLALMVPLPALFTNGLELFLQHTSADAAAALFNLTGATVFREGLVFQLTGIAIEVARERSGIHSSRVLFITSLLAGHLLLHSVWKKAVFALAVVPLGIVRNGFRIFTIGMLCVHVDPAMINSPIHTRGGPVFFLLSLVPFFILLFLLRRSERPGKSDQPAAEALSGPGNKSSP